MKHYYFILLSCLLPLTMFACKEVVSDTEQITKEQYTCDPNTQNSTSYFEKYGKNNSKITVNGYRFSEKYGMDTVKKAFEKLSNMPQEYLDYVFVTYNIPVNLYTYDIGGLTWTVNAPYYYPTSISKTDVKSFPHEFGHAAMGYVISKHPDMLKELTEISNLILKDPTYKAAARDYIINNVDILTGYKRNQWQQDKETFAEIFDTYYCSKATRNLIEKNMSKVYNFAKKYLIAPEEN